MTTNLFLYHFYFKKISTDWPKWSNLGFFPPKVVALMILEFYYIAMLILNVIFYFPFLFFCFVQRQDSHSVSNIFFCDQVPDLDLFFSPPLVFESIVSEWKVSTTTLASRAHHLLAEHWVAKWTEIKLRHMSSQTLPRLILKGWPGTD